MATGELLGVPTSNKDAVAAGITRYFTGRPCIRGHISLRAVGGSCVECKLEDGRTDRNRCACKSRYHADKQPYIDRAKRWVAANREKAYEAARKWDRSNPNVKRASVISRRAKLAGGKLSAGDISRIISRQRGRCAACGKQSKLQMDHIMPLALGGDSSPKNIQGLCQPCNGRKHAKHPVDFNRSLGLLL